MRHVLYAMIPGLGVLLSEVVMAAMFRKRRYTLALIPASFNMELAV